MLLTNKNTGSVHDRTENTRDRVDISSYMIMLIFRHKLRYGHLPYDVRSVIYCPRNIQSSQVQMRHSKGTVI